MDKEIKELTVTYTVKIATYNPKAIVEAQESLCGLFDTVHYNSTENVLGVDILTKSTELKIEGTEWV
jgi:hypothetical protein